MTTAAIDWSTAFVAGFDGTVCVLVEGVPVVLTPAGVHPTATAVTAGTVDSAWHPGTGSLTITRPDASTFDPVKEWLTAKTVWSIHEETRPVDGDVKVAPLRFDLFDADGASTAILSAPASKTVRLLGADAAATGDVTLDSVVGVPSSGYLHIGREAISYSGLVGNVATVVSRGLFGSRGRAHVVGSGTRRALAVVGDYPRFWQGRRASVFLCKLVGTTLYDPTLVFTGLIGADIQLTGNLMRRQIPVDHASQALGRKFGKVSVRAFGWQHDPDALTVNFVNTLSLGPADGDAALPGWSADAGAFLRTANAKGAALGTQINVGIAGGRARITATGPGSDVTWAITACWDPTNPRAGTTPNLGENTALVPECSMHLNGDFSVRRRGDWDLLPSTITWTVSTPAPGRAYAALVADTDNTKGLFARIYSRDATRYALGLVADLRLRAGSIEGPGQREAASRITKPTEATLGILATGETALGALRALSAALDDLQGADTGDSAIDWDQIARVFASISLGHLPEGRSYRFTGDEDSLLTPLVHECRLRGAALCLRKGRIGAYRPAQFATTEGTRRAITETDLIRGAPIEVVDGLEPPATAMRFTLPNGGSITWRDTTSAEEFGEGKTIECKALESATGLVDDANFSNDLQRSAQQLLGVLSQPQRIIRLFVNPSFWSLDAGDLVTLTHREIPDWSGNRGLVAATCQVMETRKSFLGGQARVQIALLLSDDSSLAGYAPSALVESISGADVTIDKTSPWGGNCFAPDTDADGLPLTSSPLHGFAVGMKVTLSELNNETPMADEHFTVVALPTSSKVTLDGSPSAPMVAAASSRYGCLLRFAPWTDAAVTEAQRKYLYIADATAEDLGAGDAPKRWA